ncbi:hypothetical protein [Gayadomonas joobiniege]|uniref:hypothetical protein n=1 Tax=Gayadomonas joobiniege TaxID=1234606 RepID=UPI0003683F1C|nr:hypothetical protein [Gayadomonas joobiniege]
MDTRIIAYLPKMLSISVVLYSVAVFYSGISLAVTLIGLLWGGVIAVIYPILITKGYRVLSQVLLILSPIIFSRFKSLNITGMEPLEFILAGFVSICVCWLLMKNTLKMYIKEEC